jgi:hypothetical protein
MDHRKATRGRVLVGCQALHQIAERADHVLALDANKVLEAQSRYQVTAFQYTRVWGIIECS